MIKKSLIALSLVIASISLASDNNPNKKHEFVKDPKHEGPIYTGTQKSYNTIDINAQWGNPQPQTQKPAENTGYRYDGYKIVPTVGVTYQTDCILN